jgi:phage terminase large subunit GpA-like protein
MWDQTLETALDDTWLALVPPEVPPPSEWCEQHRHISEESSEISGLFSWEVVPPLRDLIDCITEPNVHGIRCQKSAQVGWSESVFANLLAYIICVMPAPIIAMFPKDDKAKDFNAERFEPMVRASPLLAERIPLTSRQKGVTQNRKSFIGGWLKFIGARSPSGVKSSSARYAFIEEPDDCEGDVKGQGSPLTLLLERLKTFYDTFSIIGGTPTLQSLSAIECEMESTDKRYYYVPCHHCEEAAPLVWENVKWIDDEVIEHPVFGKALPHTAKYMCPSCSALWTDGEKNNNIRRARYPGMRGKTGWIATAPFTGLAGFYINDLMSSFPGAKLSALVTKYLTAVNNANKGDIKALVEFHNNQLGLAFKYKSPAPEASELEARAENYAEMTVPMGGYRLTCGVDVQGNRLALVIVAWGRGEESWRVYAGEIFGNPVDTNDETWRELESMLFRSYRHACGATVQIEATTIDASDGNTNDAVYQFCRKWKARGVMAGKGRATGEIFSTPRAIDHTSKSKASKYGLQVYIIGTEKAKDLIVGFGENAGRLRLTGRGPGRMHWYKNIRGDYYAQVTSEIKAPMRGRPRNMIYWQVKQGVRNEFLDCEVYALHAQRKLRIHLMSDAQWMSYEQKMRQPDLVAQAIEATAEDEEIISAATLAAPEDDDDDAPLPLPPPTKPFETPQELFIKRLREQRRTSGRAGKKDNPFM